MPRSLKPYIINFLIDEVDVEKTITLPGNCMDLAIRLRDPSHTVQVAAVSGESDTNYITLDSTMPALNAEDVHLRGVNLYVQSSNTNPVLEIIYYA